MKEETINYFRSLLVLQVSELRNAACKTVSDMKEGTGMLADPLDQAAIEFDRQMELSIRGRERSILNEIQQALLRIDMGFFGVCCICGKPISEQRLMARPTTRHCRDCQQRQETIAKMADRYVSPGKRSAIFYATYGE